MVVARRLLTLNEQRGGTADYVDRLIRLRIALGPDHCPRVLLVGAMDGMNVACLEEDAGDVSFRSLMTRLREPLSLAVALARTRRSLARSARRARTRREPLAQRDRAVRRLPLRRRCSRASVSRALASDQPIQ